MVKKTNHIHFNQVTQCLPPGHHSHSRTVLLRNLDTHGTHTSHTLKNKTHSLTYSDERENNHMEVKCLLWFGGL